MSALAFRNDTNETIPGFGVMRAFGTIVVDGVLVLRVQKPTFLLDRWYYVNGPTPVEPGHFGEAHLLFDAPSLGRPVLYDTGASVAPVLSQSWGVCDGQWHLRPGRVGFTILGQPQEGRVVAQQQPPMVVRGALLDDLIGHQEATVAVLASPSGLSSEVTEMRVQVRTTLIPSDVKIPTGATILAAWADNAWHMINASTCPEDVTS